MGVHGGLPGGGDGDSNQGYIDTGGDMDRAREQAL